ncbi:MAG TPA: hypothetical protein VHO68_16000 [Bacteroidales bacterium]|jgi:hypothetical protein|nr:hypothetical protein [Bacteroidales bacterium]
MKIYTNPLTQKVHLLLTPLIGEIMSSGVIKVQCRNLGITEDSLSSVNLPQLADGIRHGLVLFVGSDAAARMGKKIENLI